MKTLITIVIHSLIIFTYSQNSIAEEVDKTQACVACHGKAGDSNNAMFPKLAGQQTAYLSKQLKAFRDGTRKNAMMENIASSLKDKDIHSMAKTFSQQTLNSAGGDEKLAVLGKEKFSMCAGCHGAKATGRGQFPRLAGQHPRYIAKQLQQFKDKQRSNGMMQSITATLSTEDIAALAEYVGSLK